MLRKGPDGIWRDYVTPSDDDIRAMENMGVYIEPWDQWVDEEGAYLAPSDNHDFRLPGRTRYRRVGGFWEKFCGKRKVPV